MNRALSVFLLAASTIRAAPTIQAQDAKNHLMFTPATVKWGAGPPSLPPGAQAAALEGDQSKPGLFTLRVKMTG